MWSKTCTTWVRKSSTPADRALSPTMARGSTPASPPASGLSTRSCAYVSKTKQNLPPNFAPPRWRTIYRTEKGILLSIWWIWNVKTNMFWFSGCSFLAFLSFLYKSKCRSHLAPRKAAASYQGAVYFAVFCLYVFLLLLSWVKIGEKQNKTNKKHRLL